MKRVSRLVRFFLRLQLAVATAALAQSATPPQAQRGLTAETQRKLRASLAKAEAYLRKQQKPDGTWDDHPGITAMAATAMLRQPGNGPSSSRPSARRSTRSRSSPSPTAASTRR